MSLGRRLLDLARTNLNALIDLQGARPAGSDLDGYSDDELTAELELRRDRKRRQEEARAARAAAERAARVRASGQGMPGTGGDSSARSHATGARGGWHGGGPAGNPVPPADRARVASLYAQLETPIGADLETVKHNFRRLVREHHPDMNGGSPERQKAATERTMRLTAAYDELERILAPGAR